MDNGTIGTAGTAGTAGTTGTTETAETAENYIIILIILCFAMVSFASAVSVVSKKNKKLSQRTPQFLVRRAHSTDISTTTEFLVRRGQMQRSAKKPPMGSTWRTSHWWLFLLAAADVPLITRN